MPGDTAPDPLPLGLAVTAGQEQFSKAFVMAIASLAGCAAAEPRPDDDSVDWTLSCKLPRRPELDLQVKSLRGTVPEADIIRYPLGRKNYDDLIPTNLLAPRLLLLVLIPPDPTRWATLSADALVLRHCAFWASLRGLPASDNERSVTVDVPRANLFDVEALIAIMRTIGDGGVP